MAALPVPKSVVLDPADRQILHALQLSPRAPFARIGAVLGVSEQTVARRYQRMRTGGLVRVLARADPSRLPGTTSWTLRIGCRPGTAAATADALARRGDTSWVSIAAGGAELSCQVAVAHADIGREGLLHHLPRASNVLTFSAHQMLHRFVGRGEVDWIAEDHQLTPEQREQLLAGTAQEPGTFPRPPSGSPGETRVQPEDRALLAALLRDGRASYAALAVVTGWSQRQVAQRIAALSTGGALYFDIDAAAAAIGFRSVATLWFTVAPSHLASVGARLADHPELAFAAAYTGTANLMASAVCRDAEALYRYLTTKVAAIEEVRTLETVPLLTRVKQAHFLVENGLLRDPTA
jgi:DNA-binding Lrp family transcriptional regulator